MPSADELKKEVESSDPGDWEMWETAWNNLQPNEPGGVMAVYQPNVQLRIESAGLLQEGYKSDWSNKFPNAKDNDSYEFYLMYEQSPIDYFCLVAVDGYSAYIPVPDTTGEGPPTISLYEYLIGAAVSHSLELYKSRLDIAGIEVE